MPDPFRTVLQTWLSRVDLSHAELALVLGKTGTTVQSMTSDNRRLLERLYTGYSAVRAGYPVAALRASRLELTRVAAFDPRDQAVLLLANVLHDGTASLARREANLLEATGAQIFVVGAVNGSSRTAVDPLASSRSQFFGWPGRPIEVVRPSAVRATTQALEAVEATFRRHAFDTIVLTSTLPSGFDYVRDSAAPPGTYDPLLRELRWTFPDPPVTTSVTFDVRAVACGAFALPQTAGAWGRDLDGHEYYHDFESAEVNVPCPTSTPTPTIPAAPTTPAPTTTREPTATGLPTATPEPVPLFLPLALHEAPCSQLRRVAVALVIDTSSSMQELTDRGRTKLQAAADAAGVFLDLLAFPRDLASLVTFNADARVPQTLTADRPRLNAALSGLRTDVGTNVAAGVVAAHRELVSPRRPVEALPVIVLMTDGRASEGPSPGIAAAAAAKADGVAVFTIGLGTDVDRDQLRAMASQPGWYYEAVDAEDLADLYRSVAVELPCPADRYWGRR